MEGGGCRRRPADPLPDHYTRSLIRKPVARMTNHVFSISFWDLVGVAHDPWPALTALLLQWTRQHYSASPFARQHMLVASEFLLTGSTRSSMARRAQLVADRRAWAMPSGRKGVLQRQIGMEKELCSRDQVRMPLCRSNRYLCRTVTWRNQHGVLAYLHLAIRVSISHSKFRTCRHILTRYEFDTSP